MRHLSSYNAATNIVTLHLRVSLILAVTQRRDHITASNFIE
jgi:hypothetical protein